MGSRTAIMIKAVNNFLPRSRVQQKLKARPLVADFYIELNDPHKVYVPGEEVAGQIILILNVNTMNLILNMSMEGAIKVSSNSPLRSDKRDQLFNHSVVLYGNHANNEQALSSGEHRFPFIVKIPKKNVYTSIKFEKGEITYLLKSTLLVNGEMISTTKKLLNIVKPINLLALPEAHPKVLNFRNISSKKALRATLSSNSSLNSGFSMDSNGSINNDSVRIKMSFPYVGYLKGESIPVKLNIKHYRQISNMNGIIVTLIRVCQLDLGKDYEFESYRKDLSQSIVPLVLDLKTFKGDISTTLKIPPDCFPTIMSPTLSFQYFVEVLINLSANTKPATTNYNMNSTNSLPLKKMDLTEEDISFTDAVKPMVNVDNLKKMKNVITVTNEVIIGTERRPLSRITSASRSPTNALSDMESPDYTIGEVGSIGGLLNENVNEKLPTLSELPLTMSSLQNSETTSIRQLPVDSASTMKNVSHTDANSTNQVPTSGFTFTPLPPINIPSFIDEKETLRLQEEMRQSALLPSAPPAVVTPTDQSSPPFYQLPPRIGENHQLPTSLAQHSQLPKYTATESPPHTVDTPNSEDQQG